MRVLMSAYACEPDKGSEPEVGLQALLAVAAQHEVWLLTRSNNIPPLEAYLERAPQRERIHLVGVDLPEAAQRWKRLGGLGSLHVYHHLWQRQAGKVACQLNEEIDFDVVHHVTFGAYWIYAGVSRVGKPFVWGPLGGGVRTPWRLLPTMGLVGAAGDLIRMGVRPVVSRLVGHRTMAAAAAVILAQNPETARAIGRLDKTRILPHGVVAATGTEEVPVREPGRGHVVTVGRLIGWKGVSLAIRAMAHVPSESLSIYGDGPDRRRLMRLASRLGVEDRVLFHGRVNRQELLAVISTARAVLHPALHDDSPLAVAEALSLGTPVVCLRRGGPPVLLEHWPETPSEAVEVSTPDGTARALGEALRKVVGRRGERNAVPARSFGEGILQAYEEAAG